MKLLLVVLVGLASIGCGTGGARAEPAPLTAAAVLDAFAARGLPIGETTRYTAETDPNKLMGRPGGYEDKATWRDTRLSDPLLAGVEAGGSVEVYADAEGATRRAEYVATIARSSPLFAEYTYAHGRIVLRLSRQLTPDQAEQYSAALADLAG